MCGRGSFMVSLGCAKFRPANVAVKARERASTVVRSDFSCGSISPGNDSPRVKAPLPCAVIFAVCLATVPSLRGSESQRAEREVAAATVHRALLLIREGDIIFARMTFPLCYWVSKTTGAGWEPHAGILFRDRKGEWTVAQSDLPFSDRIPLTKFLARSDDGHVLVRRLRGGLSPEQTKKLRAAADSRMGRLYHFGFDYDDSRRTYCSKLVHDCFLEATGSRLGRVVTVRELLNASPNAPMGFWRIWFFGRIPWERRCLTTTSVMQSSQLVTVFDSVARVWRERRKE